jgi:hypothetical protein
MTENSLTPIETLGVSPVVGYGSDVSVLSLQSQKDIQRDSHNQLNN